MKKILFFLLVLQIQSAFCQQQDSCAKKNLFELSFGQSLLFISPGRQNSLLTQESIVIPTSALLFLAELRPDHRFRFPLFVNVPTESKQYLVNGTLVNEKANLTFGLGTQVKVFNFKNNNIKIFKIKFKVY